MRLHMLTEGIEEDTMLDLLRALVKGTTFEGKVYIAGGYVRDELMGNKPKDIDLVVNMPNGGIKLANYIAHKLGIHKEGSNPVIYPRFLTAKLHFKGVKHRGVDLSNIDIEFVEPRSEQYNDADSRNPDVTSGTLKQDVERRDFTVNSLLKNLTTSEIEDLTGLGREDITKGILRTPLDPTIIFAEDPLRMLRAVRFAVKYGWQFAPGLEEALKDNAARLAIISKERVRDELNKMLISQDPKRAIKILIDTDLIDYVHPKLAEQLRAMVGMEQNEHHHLDVLNHVLEVVGAATPGVPERLAALLHDIAKPLTRTPHEKKPGQYRFLGHEDEGAKLAREIMQDLKYPNDIIERVVNAVSMHMGMKDVDKASDKAIRKWARKVGDYLDTSLDLLRADAMGHSPVHRDPNDPGGANKLKARIDQLGQQADIVQRQQIINGYDLMKIFNLKPGPHLGQMLNYAQDIADENPNTTKEEMLSLIKQQFNLNV